MMTNQTSLESLNDKTSLSQFGDLARQDHEGNAQLLRHIDPIDRRKLWAKMGHSSMFSFLVTRYHMSESTAGKRIGAARTARRLPVLFTMVLRGEIHLSGIHRLKAARSGRGTKQAAVSSAKTGAAATRPRGLQFAHKEPWGKGGADTAANVGLRCPAHNALEADHDYGARFMANKRQSKPLKVREALARYTLRDAPIPPATA